MAHIRQIQEDEATGLLGKVYAGGAARAGKVANIIKVMSRNARALQASMQFYVTLMKGESPLTAARRELLAAVVSNVNGCHY